MFQAHFNTHYSQISTRAIDHVTDTFHQPNFISHITMHTTVIFQYACYGHISISKLQPYFNMHINSHIYKVVCPALNIDNKVNI